MRGTKLLGFKREKASECTLTVSLKQLKKPANAGFFVYGSIISVVGKTTVEIIELFECRQKVP